MHSSICSFWNLPLLKLFIPRLSLELFIPPLTVWILRLVLLLNTIGTMVFIDDNNFINKSGT